MITLIDNSTSAGNWDTHFQSPSNVSWSTNTFDYGGSITSATWNGVNVALNRGGTGANTASGARTNLGSTTVGDNFFTLTNPSSITFPRINADNTVSTLDASTFRSAIGAGTLSSAIISLGGQTGATQIFGIGTSGTNFNISSASNIHTFNIPYASSTNSGLLGNADWTTFNNKQSTLVSGSNIKTVNGGSILGSGDLSVGTVTSVAALTIGTSGTDLTSSVATGTTTPTITLNVPTASATNRGALSSTDWSTFNNKQDKLISSYSLMANNTSTSANAVAQVFKAVSKQTYSGTITWSGTTAPSGTTNHSYYWQQIGNLVTLKVTLVYGTAGSVNTRVVVTLPSDCPTPSNPNGLTANSSFQSSGSGSLANTISGNNGTSGTCYLRINSTGSGYEVSVVGTALNAVLADFTIQYFVS